MPTATIGNIPLVVPVFRIGSVALGPSEAALFLRRRAVGPADGGSQALHALAAAGGGAVMDLRGADVGVRRELGRRRRLTVLASGLGLLAVLLWSLILADHGFDITRAPGQVWRAVSGDPVITIEVLFFVALIGALLGMSVGAGRSPHVIYRPEQIDVKLDDVVGIDVVKDEVVRSLNLFMANSTFAEQMGGRPRRGLLFEGAPGTGKTHTAKAMAAEAGVPFLFVSGTSFQSMYYGATARKIRSYFKALRKVALAEGGAIGFMEEIDAIGVTRRGMPMAAAPTVSSPATPGVVCCGTVGAMPAVGPRTSAASGLTTTPYMSEGVGGVVNELLVQMQSFDAPSGPAKAWAAIANKVNLFLPLNRQLRLRKPRRPNILLIAATNRADSLDPALLRPGRFDRTLSFELPEKSGRRALIDHFLAAKAHDAQELDADHRNALAAVTQGYTPVRIEQLLDEALVNAVRRGDTRMSWQDVERARLVIDVGLGQPVTYTEHEKQLIATHEAGHATAAWLVAPQRRLEVLTIVKRREALGLLAHGDMDDVYTRSRPELLALIQIAMAGQCAEEIFFGEISTGPSGDLLYATNVAAQMVGAAGMTDTLVSYAAVQGNAFSDTNIVGRVLGDADGRRRVEELLQEQKAVVKSRLEAESHLVVALRDALLDRHELIGQEIVDVLQASRNAASLQVLDLRQPSPADVASDPA